MKSINFLYGTLILMLIASLALNRLNACELGEAYSYDSKKCVDINTSINPKLNAIVNGVWDGKKYVLTGA